MKGLRNTSFNKKNSMKFFIYKENHNEQSSLPKLLICVKIMMLILNDKWMFDSTLCYDNVDDYDIFKL
jgi:hypothetical protein